jgi:hypothetical protein
VGIKAVKKYKKNSISHVSKCYHGTGDLTRELSGHIVAREFRRASLRVTAEILSDKKDSAM